MSQNILAVAIVFEESLEIGETVQVHDYNQGAQVASEWVELLAKRPMTEEEFDYWAENNYLLLKSPDREEGKAAGIQLIEIQ